MQVIGCGGCAVALATTTGCTIAEVFGVEGGGQLAFDLAEPRFAALANVGGTVAVDVAGRPILLIRAGAQRLVALNRLCTHVQCDMNPDGGQGAWDGEKLTCTCHDSQFDADGKVLKGPATRDLTVYDVQFDAGTGQGTVTVGGAPEPEPEDPTPEPFRSMESPFARDDAAALAAGEQVWNTTCAGCHGPAGEGTDFLTPPATVFASGSDNYSDGYLFWRLRTGGATGPQGSIMPAYSEAQLSDEQVWQVITYLRSLGQ
ncbi:MAG: Rieske 2Fe-2S domain-containing protein [Myxococcales bacterium]|nr:Rieske 2Fe-2S domain-containing protein [Myxococcales bacterium]